jgi:pectin methylesterase-like acyl-CoA thioesterase
MMRRLSAVFVVAFSVLATARPSNDPSLMPSEEAAVNLLAHQPILSSASCLRLLNDRYSAEFAAQIAEQISVEVDSVLGGEGAEYLSAALEVSEIYCRLAASVVSCSASSSPGELISG